MASTRSLDRPSYGVSFSGISAWPESSTSPPHGTHNFLAVGALTVSLLVPGKLHQ
jgi:hypothetical protein